MFVFEEKVDEMNDVGDGGRRCVLVVFVRSSGPIIAFGDGCRRWVLLCDGRSGGCNVDTGHGHRSRMLVLLAHSSRPILDLILDLRPVFITRPQIPQRTQRCQTLWPQPMREQNNRHQRKNKCRPQPFRTERVPIRTSRRRRGRILMHCGTMRRGGVKQTSRRQEAVRVKAID